ncbi:hypothetical protein G9F73_012640 [Clostridium estertheticum]|uniref:hypothetical protein n=1 Tax=Clostridium estertheticum TaxID=238834 RepID=UPI0013EEAE50|nr:hypothetical protein [Clostridium estertheticum]MBZ9608656.1 hypothetical protein [Clostridium estertheticum]
MIKSIEELGFDEKMMELINNVEKSFNILAKEEKSEFTMLEWITENMDGIKEIENLTDREKFIFSFGILSESLEATFNQ